MIEIVRATGTAIEPYLDTLARLRMAVFREWPYLYDGTFEYERSYLLDYAVSDANLAVLARDGDRVVGMSTAMPIATHDDVVGAIAGAGYDPATVCYFGESVLHREYRGRGIGKRFFEERLAHARAHGFRTATFCAVDRPLDHPMRPADERSLGELWRSFGFVRRPEIATTFSWRDVGDRDETEKPMIFWTKELA